MRKLSNSGIKILGRFRVAGAGVALAMGAAGIARGATEADSPNSTDQAAFDSNISALSLIRSTNPAFGSISGTNPGTGASGAINLGAVGNIADGAGSPSTGTAADFSKDVYYDGSIGLSDAPNKNALFNATATKPTITVNFNLNPITGGSAAGYNLTEIRGIYGWHDHPTVSDQAYTIAVTTIAVPSFTDIATVDYAPFNNDGAAAQNNSSQVILTNLGANAVGVTSIRWIFTGATLAGGGQATQGGQVIREFNVLGTAAPEPGSLAMVGIGAAGLILRRRRSLR